MKFTEHTAPIVISTAMTFLLGNVIGLVIRVISIWPFLAGGIIWLIVRKGRSGNQGASRENFNIIALIGIGIIVGAAAPIAISLTGPVCIVMPYAAYWIARHTRVIQAPQP